jgi:hypothetical protein
MSSSRQPSNYIAYLLRCWQEGDSWRYSLEEIGTDKRHGFATLDEFVSFLLALSNQPKKSEKLEDDVDPPLAKYAPAKDPQSSTGGHH